MDASDCILDLGTNLGCFRARFQRRSHDAEHMVTTDQGIVKCLGIQYANITRRWAAPRPVPSPWNGVQDFTAFGPGCPQVKEPLFDVPGLPVFGPQPSKSLDILAETEDEFRCLNLNIFAPANVSQSGNKLKLPSMPLPVMVWVHGGAFRSGAGGVELYDGTPLVSRSLDIGNPVIVVTINYRLGVLGFVHSKQLLEDAATQNDLPEHFRSTGNLALLDISVAFSWIKRNIAHFGGDPDNIMGFGESAGSALLNYMALTPALYPSIPKMLYSSSTIFSVQLLQSAEAQTWVDAICEKNGIQPDAPDVVGQLRGMDVDTLLQSSHFACSSFRPILDGITIPSDPRSVIHGDDRWDPALQEIVFGHCENEAWLKLAYRQWTPPPLSANIAGRIPPVDDFRERAIAMYSESMDSNYQWYQAPTPFDLKPGSLSWMALDGHARYYVPGRLLAQSFVNSGRDTAAYRYIFKWTPTQWPENWPATHTADLLPMLLHKSLSGKDIVAAQSFADQIILFASGATSEKRDLGLQTHKQLTFWLSNMFDQDGTWKRQTQDEGEFGLTDEAVALWTDVFKACLDWEQTGWEGMIR